MKRFGSSHTVRGVYKSEACKNAGLGEKFGSSDGVLKLMHGFFKTQCTQDSLNPNQSNIFAPGYMPVGCFIRFEELFVDGGQTEVSDVNRCGEANKVIPDLKHNLLKLTAFANGSEEAVLMLKFYHQSPDTITVIYSSDKDENGFTCGYEWRVNCMPKSNKQIAEDIKSLIRNPDLEMHPFKGLFDRLDAAKREQLNPSPSAAPAP